jgi:hypothetical protein
MRILVNFEKDDPKLLLYLKQDLEIMGLFFCKELLLRPEIDVCIRVKQLNFCKGNI